MAESDGIIRLLPDSVANQIAAGEVIQRPASVIKELVENSVDAGAKNIEIIIKDAGKTLIQVVDDGCGMSVVDARMAFERHATSKIRCADDLFSLHTMGFRGEALPSVAAVAELEVTSRRVCDELGTKLMIRGSKVESQEPVAGPKGTNIKVKNLFFNFVARRRFLKKDSIEMSHIVHEFERLALVNTDVSFKLWSNGVLLHSLPRGPLKDRISALFGKNVGTNLVPVDTETTLVKVSGFVGLPSAARSRGQRQFLFVNGRNMRHLYFHKAVLSCYENLIAKDVQPHYFINFEVSPDRIDVNIHPQKHEIKFEDESAIWQILTASIRETLGRYNASTAIEFNTFGAPEIPHIDASVEAPADLANLTAPVDGAEYNPFMMTARPSGAQSSPGKIDFGEYDGWIKSRASAGTSVSQSHNSQICNNSHRGRQNTVGWENLYEPLLNRDASEKEDSLIPTETTGSPLFQIRNKYIVTETSDAVLLIHQHRAHVNVLYNDYVNEYHAGEIASQALMFGETLELDPRERVMLDSSIELIERIGFRVAYDAGGGNPVLEGIPGSIESNNPAKVLRDILFDLAETGVDVEADALNRILLTMARSSAIPSGQPLSDKEMEHLVASLFRLSSPGYTPDGQAVICRLNDERLASLFRTP